MQITPRQPLRLPLNVMHRQIIPGILLQLPSLQMCLNSVIPELERIKSRLRLANGAESSAWMEQPKSHTPNTVQVGSSRPHETAIAAFGGGRTVPVILCCLEAFLKKRRERC